MRRCDEIDVMAACFLKAEHQSRQAMGVGRRPRPFPTDVVILAKNTFQIAPGKKDCARPIPSPQTGFLAVMGKCTGDPCMSANAAIRTSRVFVPPVSVALPWTKRAIGERGQSDLDPPRQFTGIVNAEITCL